MSLAGFQACLEKLGEEGTALVHFGTIFIDAAS